jgi:hypothetical protein
MSESPSRLPDGDLRWLAATFPCGGGILPAAGIRGSRGGTGPRPGGRRVRCGGDRGAERRGGRVVFD